MGSGNCPTPQCRVGGAPAPSPAPSPPTPPAPPAPEGWINVCYFTNWARYRTGLINTQKDIFEMQNLDASYCTHFMYGFAFVAPDGRGSFKLESNDPNADH